MIIICGVLIALQFPVVMSSPVAALAFAFVTTASLGTVATIVGGVVAPLPLFALILVGFQVLSVILLLYSPFCAGSSHDATNFLARLCRTGCAPLDYSSELPYCFQYACFSCFIC